MNGKAIGALVVVLCAIAAIAVYVTCRLDPPPIASNAELVRDPHREPAALVARPRAAPELAAPAVRSEALARAQNDRIAALGKMIAAPLQARWDSEPKDPRWSELERRIEEFLHDPRLIGLEFVSVDCRQTLCRYEVEIDDREALQTLIQLAEELKPFETGGGIPVLDGQRMTMYLAAPGQSVFGVTLPAALRAGLGGRTPS